MADLLFHSKMNKSLLVNKCLSLVHKQVTGTCSKLLV